MDGWCGMSRRCGVGGMDLARCVSCVEVLLEKV